MISIITVNWNTYDFLWLLIESLERYSTFPYELIVIDNSEKKLRVNENHVYQFLMKTDIGYGKGLNYGVSKSYEMFPNNKFLMFLDVSCHILKSQWEIQFIKSMEKYDFLGVKGTSLNPIKSKCMFMKKNLGKYDWCATEVKSKNSKIYDVGIKAYYKIMADGYNIGFMSTCNNRYKTNNGEEFVLNETPLIYHHYCEHDLNEKKECFPENEKDKKSLFEKIPWRLP
jgi:hypothetical protein